MRLVLGRLLRREQQARAQQHEPRAHDEPVAFFAKHDSGLLQGSGQLVDEIEERDPRQIDLLRARQRQQQIQWSAEFAQLEERRCYLPGARVHRRASPAAAKRTAAQASVPQAG